jgi:hypothetical protein
MKTENICEKCNYKTTNKQHFSQHLLTNKHINGTAFQCETCNKQFNSLKRFKEHTNQCICLPRERFYVKMELDDTIRVPTYQDFSKIIEILTVLMTSEQLLDKKIETIKTQLDQIKRLTAVNELTV